MNREDFIILKEAYDKALSDKNNFQNDLEIVQNRIAELETESKENQRNRSYTQASNNTLMYSDQIDEYNALLKMNDILTTGNQDHRFEYEEMRERTELDLPSRNISGATISVNEEYENARKAYANLLNIDLDDISDERLNEIEELFKLQEDRINIEDRIQELESEAQENQRNRAYTQASNNTLMYSDHIDEYNALLRMKEIIDGNKQNYKYEYEEMKERTNFNIVNSNVVEDNIEEPEEEQIEEVANQIINENTEEFRFDPNAVIDPNETNPQIIENNKLLAEAYSKREELIKNRNNAQLGDSRTIDIMNKAIEEQEKIIQNLIKANKEIEKLVEDSIAHENVDNSVINESSRNTSGNNSDDDIVSKDDGKETVLNPSQENYDIDMLSEQSNKRKIITLEEILLKIKRHPTSENPNEVIQISNFQSKLYEMAKTNMFAPYYTSKNRTNWIYSAAHAISYTAQTLVTGVKKLVGNILVSGKTRRKMEIMEARVNNLSDEEIQILENQYIGSNVKTLNQPRYINNMIKKKTHESRTKEIVKKQQEYVRNYKLAVENYKYIKAIEQKLDDNSLTSDEKIYYEEAKEKLSIAAGTYVKQVLFLKNTLDRDFSSGRHGQDEDIEKGSSDHMGGLFSKRATQDGELLAKEAAYQKEMLSALGVSSLSKEDLDTSMVVSAESGLKAIEAFIGYQKELQKETNIKSDILGSRSVGNRDFVVIPEGLDYSSDTLFKDMMSTIIIAGSVANIIQNAQARAQIETESSSITDINNKIKSNNDRIASAQDSISKANSELDSLKSSSKSAADAQSEALGAQIDKSMNIDVPNAIETAELRKLGKWSEDLPKSYGSHAERFAAGAAENEKLRQIMSTTDPIQRVKMVTEEFKDVITAEGKLQTSFVDALRKYNDSIKVKHPEWAVDEQIAAMERLTTSVPKMVSANEQISSLLTSINNFSLPSLNTLELLDQINGLNISLSDIPNAAIIAGAASISGNGSQSSKTEVEEKEEIIKSDAFSKDLSKLSKKDLELELKALREYLKNNNISYDDLDNPKGRSR